MEGATASAAKDSGSRSERAGSRLPNLLVTNRNFVLLWAAYGVSALGDHLSEQALFQSVGGFTRDDSIRVQALMTFCFFLPFVALGPVAGWWADRFSRKWTMIGADLVRCTLMGSLPWVVPWLLGLRLGDFAVGMPLAVAGMFAAFFSPARQAMVPTLIRDDQLVRANAMISGLGTIGAILSAVIGGYLVDLANAGHLHLDWNYRLDALSFVFSAVCLSGIVMSRSRRVAHPITTGVWTPLRQGFTYVRQHRRVLQMILLGTVFWAAAGIVTAVIPAIVRDIFGGRYTDAGIYRGLVAAGLAIGAALLTLIGPSLPTALSVLAALAGAAFWLWGLDVALIFKLGRVFSGLCLFMIGVHGAGILVNIMVIIQRFVPDSRRGRVFGVADMCTMAAIVATTGLLGLPHIEHLDRFIPWLLGLAGAGMLLTFVLAWRTYRGGSSVPAATWVIQRFVRFVVAFWYRAERIGPCTIPCQGGAVLVVNDASNLESLIVRGTCTHRSVEFASGRDTDLARVRRAMADGGCVGVVIQRAVDVLSVAFERTDIVVVPCHILATEGSSWLRRNTIRVSYGKPIDLAGLRGRTNDALLVEIDGRLKQLGSSVA